MGCDKCLCFGSKCEFAPPAYEMSPWLEASPKHQFWSIENRQDILGSIYNTQDAANPVSSKVLRDYIMPILYEFDNHGSEKNIYFMNCLTSLYKATNYNLHRHFNKANISFIYRNLETKWYSKGETMLLLQTCPHTATLCSNKRCSESVIGRVTGSAFYQTVVHGGCYHIIIQQVELSLQNKNESLSFLLATMANIKS